MVLESSRISPQHGMMPVMVGHPYPLPLPPGDWVRASLQPSGLHLVSSMCAPSADERNDIRFGRARLGWLVEGPAVWILTKFGSQPWCDAPWSAHLGQEAVYVPLDVGHLMCQITLIDGQDKVVRGLRAITAPPDWTARFGQAVHEHVLSPPSDSCNYDTKISEIQRRYRTIDLVERAKKLDQVCELGQQR